MTYNEPLIVITGPTGSGKTKLAIECAKKLEGEIICADSTTVYSSMDIGTDKPTLDPSTKVKDGHYIIDGVRHHLLDRFTPDEDFNVSLFVDVVEHEIEQIRKRGNIPFIVGGSLLYIDAFVYNYQLPAVAPDEKLREKLEKLDTAELLSRLYEIDPDAKNNVDQNNRRRIIRAIEVVTNTDKPFAEQRSRSPLPSNTLYLAIDREREQLYASINQRVDEMFRRGFVDEVQALQRNYGRITTLQTTGYKQVIQYLEGETGLETAIEKTKQAHRNYAKRQLTWLRKNPDVRWVKDVKEAEDLISGFLKK